MDENKYVDYSHPLDIEHHSKLSYNIKNLDFQASRIGLTSSLYTNQEAFIPQNNMHKSPLKYFKRCSSWMHPVSSSLTSTLNQNARRNFKYRGLGERKISYLRLENVEALF